MKTNEAGIKRESNVFFATPGNRAKNLFYYVSCTGHFYYEDTYSLQRENYNSLLIMYVLNGSMKVECYGKTYMVKKDDVLLLNCHDPHGYSAIKDLETIWLHFDSKNGKELFESLYDVKGCIMDVRDPCMVKKYIQRIYDMHQFGTIIDEAMQSAYIATMIAEFYAFETSGSSRGNTDIEKSIFYIQQNFSNRFSIKELADHVALSEHYFSRKFKKETGFTPHEYITKARINQAKILLKSTDKTLAEIAGLCGLTNEASLIKTFKKHIEMTPGQFRSMFL